MRRGLALPIAVVACLMTSLQHLGCSSSDKSGAEPDTDGDGLSDAEEVNVYGTSPVLADTDGDGFSDSDEVVKFAFDPANAPYRFNPRVADVPQMTVAIAGPPVVTIQTTDDHGTTTTIDNSRSDGVTTGVTNSGTNTNDRSDTLSTSRTNTSEVSVTAPLDSDGNQPSTDGGTDAGGNASGIRDSGAEIAGGPTAVDAVGEAEAPAPSSSGATITLTKSVSTSVSPSTTFDTSIAVTDEQMRQNSETLTQDQSYAQSHNVTNTAGFLKVPTVIQNRSNLAFRVTNIVLAAALVDGAGVVVPVQNLILDQGILSTFQPFSLAPGEQTGTANFISIALTLETTEVLLRNARALVIRLATYELSDSSGKSFAFNVTEIAAKTALVVLDYGPLRPPELYQVATNLDPGHPGVTASKVFGDILRVPYVAESETGLTSVREVAVDASGGAHWVVVRLHKDGPDIVTIPYGAKGEGYDFGAIELHAGDVLHVAFAGAGEPPGLGGGPQLGTGPMTDGGLKVTRP